eukprot:TRINITY_DN23935_c0_g1_i1.p2 TRINITY_DN23935_c0_g1~~TRINITY_DN23935_c0_g1_i1.p2  ORF type:complete len:170 (+),score=39.64 TRINITY_DN23935_c0_g1_i1:145-654(+)
MIRRPPRSTLSSSSAASDVYKRQVSTQSTGRDTPTMPGIFSATVASTVSRAMRASARHQPFCTIPVKEIASVLKLNVRDEATALKLDAKMKNMTELMRKHQGFTGATRYVCKGEWAYELSFVFDGGESFAAWKTSATRDEVHQLYLDALEECNIAEEDVYAGARVHDRW